MRNGDAYAISDDGFCFNPIQEWLEAATYISSQNHLPAEVAQGIQPEEYHLVTFYENFVFFLVFQLRIII